MGKYEHHGVTVMRNASLKRRADAWALLIKSQKQSNKKEHARGAMYLGGYSVECKIKAIAMETHGCTTLRQLVDKLNLDERDVYDHGLEALLRKLLTSYERFRDSPAWRSFSTQVNAWRPTWRYDGEDAHWADAKSFLEAVDVVRTWLDRNN